MGASKKILNRLSEATPTPWWDTDSRKAPKAKPELEAKVEARFVRRIKALGWKHRKINGLGNKDWQDQLVIAPGVICLIEFKRPGGMGKLSPTQEIHHQACRDLGVGHLSLVTDSAEEAVDFVESCVAYAACVAEIMAKNPYFIAQPKKAKKK